MTYRQLPVSEWSRLADHFSSRNVPQPDPRLCSIFSAFDDSGDMLAFLVCQFKLHAEPLLSTNPLALPGLVAFAEHALISLGFTGAECFVAAKDERVKTLSWRLGFRPTGEEMFVKRIGQSQQDNRKTNLTNSILMPDRP